MRLLELFSGTKSVSSAVGNQFDEIISVDIDAKSNPTICTDILQWDYKVYPVGHFDCIWASPPCCSFSKLQYSHKTIPQVLANIEKNGLPILRRAEEIIAYFQPARYYIENPETGLMKNYLDKPFYDVDYCRYSNWGYKKPTRIWTNVTNFSPLRCGYCCVNGYYHDGRYRHNSSVCNSSLNQRYKIPEKLIQELFNAQV